MEAVRSVGSDGPGRGVIISPSSSEASVIDCDWEVLSSRSDMDTGVHGKGMAVLSCRRRELQDDDYPVLSCYCVITDRVRVPGTKNSGTRSERRMA